MKKICALCVICGSLLSLFAGCNGSDFSASYTDPKTGTTYYGGTRTVVDPKR